MPAAPAHGMPRRHVGEGGGLLAASSTAERTAAWLPCTRSQAASVPAVPGPQRAGPGQGCFLGDEGKMPAGAVATVPVARLTGPRRSATFKRPESGLEGPTGVSS